MKIMKKIILFSILLMGGFMIFNYTYATEPEYIDTIFEPGAKNPGVELAEDNVESIISNFIMVIKIIGTGVAIIMLLLLGSKYMMGSIEERAEIKKHAVVYVVGAIIFFGAFGILSIIQNGIKGTFVVNEKEG